MLVEATVFNLMQIGELAKVSLSDEAKAQLTAIPWPQLYGMRNRIVHGYAGVNMNIVWDTIQNRFCPNCWGNSRASRSKIESVTKPTGGVCPLRLWVYFVRKPG